MKVVGIALHGDSAYLESGPRPIEAGYLPLDDFTGLLGRNDSGKSTLLGCVYDLLSGEGRLHGIVFAEVVAERFKEILKHCLADLLEEVKPGNGYYGGRQPKHRNTWWGNEHDLTAEKLEDIQFVDGEGLLVQWLAHLESSYEGSDAEAWRQIVNFLASDAQASERFVVGFEPSISRSALDSDSAWNLMVCLPPESKVPGEIREALERVGVFKAGWARRKNLRRKSRISIGVSGDRVSLGGPLVLAPIGQTTVPLLPRPLFPRGSAEVLKQTEEAVANCVRELRWADHLLACEVGPMDETLPDVVGSPWVVDNGNDHWELARDVPIMCRKLENGIAEILPDAIASSYRVRIRTNPPKRWHESHLRIEIEPVGSEALSDAWDQDSGSMRLENLAEGFQLWVNISILYSVQVIQLAAASLSLSNVHLSSWLSGAWTEDPHEVETVEEQKNDLRESLQKIRNPESGLIVATGSDLWFLDSEGETSEEDAAELVRGRLLLIDEPERFLHPRLQREMASWLDRSVTQGIPVLAATHSVPFMGIRGNATYTYLLREGGSATEFLPITPGQLSEMGLAAEELGLDRGELLALVNTVLWVEGEMDREVLMKAFPTQIREEGILIVPLKGFGHAKAKAVLETSLMRFSNSQVAVWLDGVDRAFVDEVSQNPKIAEAAAKRASAREPETIAKLVHESNKVGRRIHPIGVERPGYDVFDLLDEEVIRERFPKFPGHQEARAEFQRKLDLREVKQGDWKNCWAKWYEIQVDEKTCGDLASEMRRSGRITEPLHQVIEQCREISKGT